MAIDWSTGMGQAFVYEEVDPATWLDSAMVDGVSSCSISRDVNKDTYESASLAVDGGGWLGRERIVRCYMDASQGAEAERICVGTFAFQGRSSDRDGRRRENAADGYGFLQDMAQDSPPYGFCVTGDPSEAIAMIVAMSCRAPFVGYEGLPPLAAPVWAADGDTWLTFALAIAAEAGCTLRTDPWGRICLVPVVPAAALAPVWEYGADSCVVLPDDSDETDLFDVPNWCEVTVTNGTSVIVGVAENDDPASPASTVARGHRVTLRLSNPDGLSTACTQADADAFAARSLSEASVVRRRRRYRHAWVPVRAGDAVTLSFDGEGSPVAVVESQDIELKVGVEVEEVAVVSERVWSA